MRTLRALCLDLDDTILDDQSSVEQGWQQAADHWVEACPQLTREAAFAELARARRWYWEDEVRERRGRLDLYAARFQIMSRALERVGPPAPQLAAALARELTDYREASVRLVPGRVNSSRDCALSCHGWLSSPTARRRRNARKSSALLWRIFSITSRSKASSAQASPSAGSTSTCSRDLVRLRTRA